jgi:2-oxo-4-hydroxy-4-carboxy-5-ureidoimidazoline decarboxylase
MLKCLDIIISGELMYNKSFSFLSKNMDEGEIINLLKSIYEHSAWVPQRLLSQNISEIKTKEQLQLVMQKIVDNSSEKEKLNLIKAHPELGKKLKKQEKLTKFSEEEQKSAGLDQCSDEEFEILTKLNHEYRLKFEFPFIIAVRGLSKNQIIDNMKKRVNNRKSVEFETAINEIHKIAKLRIKDLPY